MFIVHTYLLILQEKFDFVLITLYVVLPPFYGLGVVGNYQALSQVLLTLILLNPSASHISKLYN